MIDDASFPSAPVVGTVRFGQVTGQETASCQALGFPEAELRSDRRRDTHLVKGHVNALQAFKSRVLSVHVDKGIVPRERKNGANWRGISGAALFCGPLLTGVVVTARKIAADVLGTAPVAAFADLPGFREALAEHGLNVRLEPATVAEQQLAAYTAAAQREARRHPYAGVLLGSHPPLAAVYRTQQIRRRSPSSAAAAEIMSTDDVPDDPKMRVIIAGPGGGKSSLLRTWLEGGIQRWQEGTDKHLLPVLLTASDLAGLTLTEALAKAVSDLGLHQAIPPDFFASPPRPGARWLILLDGLDEVSNPAQRRKILESMFSVATSPYSQLYRIVIATRPLPDAEFDILRPEASLYDLRPFDHDDLAMVAQRWFQAANLPDPAASAQHLVQALKVSWLSVLARTPLVLAMLCQLHAAHPDEPLPKSRYRLYSNFIGLLQRPQPPVTAPAERYPAIHRYEKPEVRAQADIVLATIDNLIDHLAAQRQAGDRRSAVDIVQNEPRRRAQRPQHVRADEWNTFLNSVLRRSGLLTPRSDDLDFLHQTLQEYLAARHLIRDVSPQAVSDAFPQSRRHRPRTAEADAARAWFLRCWQSPDANPLKRLCAPWFRRCWQSPREESSYIGFLIEGAQESGLTMGIKCLTGLASRGGLNGRRFIAELARLGTLLPDAIVRTACDGFLVSTRDSNLKDSLRVEAAETLIELRDSRGADPLYTLILDTTRSYLWRVKAAVMLAKVSDARGADLLRTFALDTSLLDYQRVEAAEALAELRDPRGADLLRTFALDSSLLDYQRVEAAEVLAELRDPRGADLLRILALDASLGNSRVKAAEVLAELRDPRGADLLRILALDASLGDSRVKAAEVLAELRDPRGADLLRILALDSTVSSDPRVRAAELLAKLRDSRGTELLYTFALGHTLHDYWRVKAAEALAKLCDPRGADILHAFALDVSLANYRRVEAAGALAKLRDPRGTDVLGTLALGNTLQEDSYWPYYWQAKAATELIKLRDPRAADIIYTLAGSIILEVQWRVEAAEALVMFGDSRGADCFHDFARDSSLGGYQRVKAAEVLVELHDPRGADVLHTLALDASLGDLRVRAAGVLVELRDLRGADVLCALAADSTLRDYCRAEAEKMLTALHDPRVSKPRPSMADRLLTTFRWGQRSS
ncbi:hypothetical protein ACFRIC_41320 [Streptomyces sp. NPDC056738]|uniref:hypothetical protein n=1 Tax=Streptomyces sp. NPDC056738 TaxID=3345933 RepID=UPI0036B83105